MSDFTLRSDPKQLGNHFLYGEDDRYHDLISCFRKRRFTGESCEICDGAYSKPLNQRKKKDADQRTDSQQS